MLESLLMVLVVFLSPLVLVLGQTETENEEFTQLYKSNLRQMVNMRNLSVEPCEDFYKHACGNNENEPEDEEEVPPYLQNKQDRMDFFQKQYLNFQTLPGQRVAQLYGECKRRRENHVLMHEPMKSHWEQLIEQVNGLRNHEAVLNSWPFLRHQWERRNLENQLNWISLSAQMAAQGVPTLLNIYFAEGTIYIAPLEDLPCPSLEQFQLSMSEVLEGRHRHVGQVIGHEMRVLCRGLRGELPLLPQPKQEILQLDENTMEYFQQFFAHLNFTSEKLSKARKLPLDVNKITQAWQILRETEPRIIFNYILWQIKEKLIYEDCFEVTQEFERLLQAEYWQWHVLNPYLTREVALATYQLHTTRFQQKHRSRYTQRDWLAHLWPKMREQQDHQISRILQAHALSYLNIRELTLHYQPVKFLANSFYHNLLSLRRAHLQLSFLSPYIDEEDVLQPAYFLRHFLNFVILSLYRPTYHYYATQGLELWLQSQLLLDTDGYYTALDCLDQQSLHYGDAIYRRLSSSEVYNIFHFYRGFQTSLRDYHFWLQGERFAFAENFIFQYFGLDTQRILFYAVAQQLCNRQEKIFAPQLNRVYMNLPEFQEAFKCDTDKPMNPANKCMINQCE